MGFDPLVELAEQDLVPRLANVIGLIAEPRRRVSHALESSFRVAPLRRGLRALILVVSVALGIALGVWPAIAALSLSLVVGGECVETPWCLRRGR